MSDAHGPSRLRRRLVGGAWALGAAAALVAGAAFWLLATTSGAQVVLGHAVALAGGSVGVVEGRLAGPLAVDAAEVALPAARVRATAPRVAALAQEQQGEVQELAVAALVRQKERVAAYGTQARFALAQIYDQATVGKDSNRAPAQ